VTELTAEDVARVVAEVMDARARIDAATHAKHQEFIAEWIEEERERRRRREAIRQQVIGWGIITVLGGVGYAAYHGFVFLVAKTQG
jgi:hypothetical protein